jgi:hypothetical protein
MLEAQIESPIEDAGLSSEMISLIQQMVANYRRLRSRADSGVGAAYSSFSKPAEQGLCRARAGWVAP